MIYVIDNNDNKADIHQPYIRLIVPLSLHILLPKCLYTSCEVSIFLILQVIGALYATEPGGANLKFRANFLKTVMFFTNLEHCQ